MAEIEFIMGESEQLQVMDYILQTGGMFLPCIGYQTPKYKLFKHSLETFQCWEKAYLTSGVEPILVLWEDISIYPMQFDRIEKKDEVLFYPGKGGPYLDYSPSRIISEKGKPYLIGGSVHYLRHYGILVNGAWQSIPAPQELKDKYEQIVKFIRSMSTKVKWAGDKRRSYWIGKEALKMLKEGASAGVELELP